MKKATALTCIFVDVGRVKVRVIRTDEELIIARSVARELNLGSLRRT
jgi:acetate kinase